MIWFGVQSGGGDIIYSDISPFKVIYRIWQLKLSLITTAIYPLHADEFWASFSDLLH